MLKRLFKMISYSEKTEPWFVWSFVLVHSINAIKPFFIFLLSKFVIEAVIGQFAMTEVIKNTILMLAAFFVLSIVSGFFQNRTQLHSKKFLKKNNMNKAVKLLNAQYEFTESNKIQHNLTELKQLERFRVFTPLDFLDKFGMLIGGLIGGGIAIYFSINLFGKDGLGNFSGYVINTIFITLILGLNIIGFFVTNHIYTYFGKHISGESTRLTRYLDSYFNLIYDYKVAKDIRLYDKALAKSFSKKHQQEQKRSNDFMGNFFTITLTLKRIIEGSLACLIFLFITLRVYTGMINLSEVFMYIGIINLFCEQLGAAMEGISVLISSDKYRKKLFNILELQNDFSDTKKDLSIQNETLKNTKQFIFEFKNVSFKYPDTDKFVLKNLNLKLDLKQKLALVGKNGSGKTTLIKLLVKLYNPIEGEILLNGKNIQEYNYEEYKKIFSVVFQDFKLLALPIGENIAVSENYNEEKIYTSLQKVGMQEFSKRHSLKSYLYQNFENNGIEISGGEAQKIAMARAIYHSGNFYILDEPTAALDPIAEAEIYEHFDSITSNNSAIYISHRLSSCKFCDKIAVLDKGELIQEGTHNELVTADGIYQELWAAQAKYYVK